MLFSRILFLCNIDSKYVIYNLLLFNSKIFIGFFVCIETVISKECINAILIYYQCKKIIVWHLYFLVTN